MSAVRELDLAQVNARWGRDASALVEWAVGLGQPTIVTTNFRPFEAVILHLVTRVNPQVPVVWMDNGYNTEATYRFADEVTKQLGLNLKIYLPRRSRAHREAVEGRRTALAAALKGSMPTRRTVSMKFSYFGPCEWSGNCWRRAR